MLNFIKTVSCLLIRTAQQIDTELMHHFEKFRKNLLVKFYSISMTHELKQGKTLVWGFAVQNIGSLKPRECKMDVLAQQQPKPHMHTNSKAKA